VPIIPSPESLWVASASLRTAPSLRCPPATPLRAAVIDRRLGAAWRPGIALPLRRPLLLPSPEVRSLMKVKVMMMMMLMLMLKVMKALLRPWNEILVMVVNHRPSRLLPAQMTLFQFCGRPTKFPPPSLTVGPSPNRRTTRRRFRRRAFECLLRRLRKHHLAAPKLKRIHKKCDKRIIAVIV